QFEPFCADIEFKIHKTGRIAARFSETFNKSAADGVRDLNEYHGDGMGCLLKRPNMRAAGNEYDVRRERNEFIRVLAQAFGIAPRPTGIDPEIASDGPTELLQRLNKCIERNFRLWIVLLSIRQDSDASCAGWGLGMSLNWPC